MFLTCFSNVVLGRDFVNKSAKLFSDLTWFTWIFMWIREISCISIAYQNVVWRVGISGGHRPVSSAAAAAAHTAAAAAAPAMVMTSSASVRRASCRLTSALPDVYITFWALQDRCHLDIYGAHSVVSLKTLPSNKNLMGKNNLGQRTKRVQRTLHIWKYHVMC